MFHGFLFLENTPDVLTWHSRRLWYGFCLYLQPHLSTCRSSIYDAAHHNYFSLTLCFLLLLSLCTYYFFLPKTLFFTPSFSFQSLLFGQVLLFFFFFPIPSLGSLQETCDAFSMWFIKLKFKKYYLISKYGFCVQKENGGVLFVYVCIYI